MPSREPPQWHELPPDLQHRVDSAIAYRPATCGAMRDLAQDSLPGPDTPTPEYDFAAAEAGRILADTWNTARRMWIRENAEELRAAMEVQAKGESRISA